MQLHYTYKYFHHRHTSKEAGGCAVPLSQVLFFGEKKAKFFGHKPAAKHAKKNYAFYKKRIHSIQQAGA